jgi:hypothetical protein
MRKLFLLTLIIIYLKGFSQAPGEGNCWTPEMDTSEFYNLPWFDNNDMLEQFLDSIGYPSGARELLE